MQTKFIIILGSLMSGLGKGVITSSISKILSFYDYKVLPLKFDGYLNYDSGTINPYKHGEVFVLEDGAELDMDFGMYERFLNVNLKNELSITGGKIMTTVISKERVGEFLGDDIQIIPHLTGEIIKWVKNVAAKNNLDALVIEVGGTVGDLENGYFIEAMRQLSLSEDVEFINLTYIPQVGLSKEQKTKPTQLAYRLLMQLGIKPDLLICRCGSKLAEKTKEKLALFTNLTNDRIIDDSDVDTIYSMPIMLMAQGADKILLDDLGFKNTRNERKVREWAEIVDRLSKPKKKVSVAIVGKYTGADDSYASVKEALVSAGAELGVGVSIEFIDSSLIEKKGYDLSPFDGILVPGGFGNRGIEGMIAAIKYARENNMPYLGICLGMQLMCIEFARNVCGIEGATSSEFDKNAEHKIISLMSEQEGVTAKGATMRLGTYGCMIQDKNSLAYGAYKQERIMERHRHRYEFNNEYRELFAKGGMVISGMSPDKNMVEIVEWQNGLGIGTQAHPEFKSRPGNPAPLFTSFVNLCIRTRKT
jgi:CTP synthase